MKKGGGKLLQIEQDFVVADEIANDTNKKKNERANSTIKQHSKIAATKLTETWHGK